MNTRNQELAQSLQTPNLELSRLQPEVSHLRTSVERNQPTENPDAANLRNLREKESKTISTTVRPDKQQQQNHRRLQQPGGDPVQSRQQNSGVPKKKPEE